MKNNILSVKSKCKQLGFTLMEIMIAIAILGITLAIALPSLGEFSANMRADNTISELHRMLLTARNTAINTGRITTVCPLSSTNECGADWKGEITVFTNDSNTVAADLKVYNPVTESIIVISEGFTVNDTLEFGNDSVIYNPTGNIENSEGVGNFTICPENYPDSSRALTIGLSGRTSPSTKGSGGYDVDRDGNRISCT